MESQELTTEPAKGGVVGIAASSGVIAAAIDVWSGLLSGGFWSTFAMATSAAVVLVLFFVLHLVLASLLGYWFRTRQVAPRVPPSLTVAVILVSGFAAVALLKQASTRPGPERALLEAFACAVPLMAFLALQAGYGRFPARARILALAFPTGFAGIVALEWLRRFPQASDWIPSTALLFGYPLIVGCAMSIAATTGRRGRALHAVGVLAVALILLPAAIWAIRKIGPDASGVEEPHRPVKRILLITIDTLRADVVGGELTPHIAGFSKDGVVFGNAVSPAPWTLPAISSIMTGLSPAIHGGNHERSSLSPRFETLAERLQRAGYLTAGFGKNVFLLPERNLNQGFQRYEFYPRSAVLKSLGASLLERVWHQEFRLDVSDAEITGSALDWIEEHRSSDFFLWVHYFGPHHPYSPPPDFQPRGAPPAGMERSFWRFRAVRQGTFAPDPEQRAWIRSLYDAEVRATDAAVGALLEGLRAMELYQDSLILLTSDHGEEFWEHDGFEHGHTLYRELLAVPLIAKLPGSRAKGEVPGVVSTEQIMSTVLESCGIEHDRRHLAPALWPLEDRREPVFSSAPLYFEERMAVRFGPLWYIHSLVSDREELYDLGSDPFQQSSILRSAPKELEAARSLLAEWRERMRGIRQVYSTEEGQELRLSPGTEDRLRSLGYIQ